jgi:hypothetical protein
MTIKTMRRTLSISWGPISNGDDGSGGSQHPFYA